MKTKTLLGVSLAAAFVISMVGFAHAGGLSDYLSITGASAIDTTDGFQGTATTEAKVPRSNLIENESNAIVGFGWVDLDTGEGFLAAIHPSFKDSTQNPRAWHTHPVSLSVWDFDAGQFCIEDLRSSQGGLALNNNGVLVNVDTTNSENEFVGVTGSNADAVVSFVANVDTDCPVFSVNNQNNPFGPAQVKVQVTDLESLP